MDIFVFGCGGHAKVVSEIVEAEGAWRIAGYVDTSPKAARFLDREVFEEARFVERHKGAAAVLALGDNAARRRLCKAHGEALTFPPIVHPSALLAPSCHLGEGTVVMPGAIVNAQAKIGRFCVVNTGAVVEHDCRLGNFASVAPRACVCGGCTLSEGCAVGANATVIQCLTLGPWSLVGAAAVVCSDVEARTTVVGAPARARPRPVKEAS